WPLQPLLDNGKKQTMRLAAISGQESFIFPSPNVRFLAYLAERPAGWCGGMDVCGRPLAIYDQVEDTFQYVPYPGTNPPNEYIPSGDLWNFERGYDIKWSADSSTLYGFTITSGNASLTYRITGFSTSPTSLSVEMLSDGFQVQNKTVYPVRVIAVSSDGSRFLTGTYGFWLYDFADLSESKLLTDRDDWIIGASFDPHDDNVIWYINKFGLFCRDLITAEEVLIDASINSNRATDRSPWFTNAIFAPDLSAIALYQNGNGLSDRIFIYRLQSQATPTP
ncbi:MAG: hypothetical protein KF726_21850, partial [Anaerolineae bacterium]|nr:hypothetical protein [Anaerolineae bacterium]